MATGARGTRCGSGISALPTRMPIRSLSSTPQQPAHSSRHIPQRGGQCLNRNVGHKCLIARVAYLLLILVTMHPLEAYTRRCQLQLHRPSLPPREVQRGQQQHPLSFVHKAMEAVVVAEAASMHLQLFVRPVVAVPGGEPTGSTQWQLASAR